MSGVSEAADGQDDGHKDEGHGGGQDDVQPDVEVRTVWDPADLAVWQYNTSLPQSSTNHHQTQQIFPIYLYCC